MLPIEPGALTFLSESNQTLKYILDSSFSILSFTWHPGTPDMCLDLTTLFCLLLWIWQPIMNPLLDFCTGPWSRFCLQLSFVCSWLILTPAWTKWNWSKFWSCLTSPGMFQDLLLETKCNVTLKNKAITKFLIVCNLQFFAEPLSLTATIAIQQTIKKLNFKAWCNFEMFQL